MTQGGGGIYCGGTHTYTRVVGGSSVSNNTVIANTGVRSRACASTCCRASERSANIAAPCGLLAVQFGGGIYSSALSKVDVVGGSSVDGNRCGQVSSYFEQNNRQYI